MKTIKKLITLITATAISSTALCSCANINTALTVSELLPDWSNTQTTGAIQLTFNDDMKETIKDTYPEDGFIHAALNSDIVVNYTLTQKDETVSLNGVVSIADSDYNYDIITNDTDTYISVDTLDSVARLSNQIDSENIYPDTVLENLAAQDITYVKIDKKDLSDTIPISDDALEVVKNEFIKNIDISSILTSNDNAITLTADGLDILNIFIGAASKLTEDIEESSSDTYNIDDILNTLKSISNNTYSDEDVNAEIYNYIRNILENIEVNFTATVFDNYIDETLDIFVFSNNIKITSYNKTVEYTGEISTPTSFTTESEVKEYHNAIAEPDFSAVKIWWDNNAVVSIDNVNITYKDGTNKSMTCTVINKDDRIYLPLRSISEGMGYEVTWDGEKAGVIVNGENVEMSGFIKDDRTYIKVRDFEKLGIKVEYLGESDSGVHTAMLINE